MKKWIGVVALPILVAGCSGEKEAEEVGQPGGTDVPVVIASNYPLQYFAERISTPLVDVRLAVPVGEDPAFWQPEPEDIQAMQQADLVILNGASYESWLNNVSLPSSRLVVTSERFKEQFIAMEESATHSHGLEGEHEHSATAFTTWLDLTLAVEQARAVKDAFASRWPEHRGQFETQFGNLAQELEALDTEMKAIVEGSPGLPVVFSHPVYQYFEQRYGLNGRSVHWEPHETPSDDMWQEFATLLGSHPAKWMIWEGEPSPDITAKLAELDIQSVVFDPCAGEPISDDFVSAMKLNMAALKTVYGQL
jgi:zinc transport system substrate-binding protein